MAVNDALAKTRTLINEDSYGEGWLARIRPSRWEEDVKLLVAGESLVAAVEAYMNLQLAELRN